MQIMHSGPSQGVEGHKISALMAAAGSRQEAEAMAKALQPLLAAGAVTQLLQLLQLLGVLRLRGAAVRPSCEAGLLRCLLVLISAGGSPAALLNGGGDGQQGGLPVSS